MTEDERPRVRWLNEECHVCGARLNSWDAKISRALRYQHKVCEKCVAHEYDRTVQELRDTMEDFFGMRPCQGV